MRGSPSTFTFALTLALTLTFTLTIRAEAQDGGATVALEPYRLWWSFPRDDQSAVEIDDPDLHVSTFSSKWQFAALQSVCDVKRAARVMRSRDRGDGTPVRELRIDSVDGEGQVHHTTRCVLPLAAWRGKLGKRLVERLEDELDAHVSFLIPRKQPPLPVIPK